MIDIQEILKLGIKLEASDIHIVRRSKPIFRINKELIEISDLDTFSDDDIYQVFQFFIDNNSGYERAYKEEKRIDLNYEFLNNKRFRINISSSNGYPVFTIRIIKNNLPRFEDLNLPDIVRRVSYLPQGLILVTGKSNSRKKYDT